MALAVLDFSVHSAYILRTGFVAPGAHPNGVGFVAPGELLQAASKTGQRPSISTHLEPEEGWYWANVGVHLQSYGETFPQFPYAGTWQCQLAHILLRAHKLPGLAAHQLLHCHGLDVELPLLLLSSLAAQLVVPFASLSTVPASRTLELAWAVTQAVLRAVVTPACTQLALQRARLSGWPLLLPLHLHICWGAEGPMQVLATATSTQVRGAGVLTHSLSQPASRCDCRAGAVTGGTACVWHAQAVPRGMHARMHACACGWPYHRCRCGQRACLRHDTACHGTERDATTRVRACHAMPCRCPCRCALRSACCRCCPGPPPR